MQNSVVLCHSVWAYVGVRRFGSYGATCIVGSIGDLNLNILILDDCVACLYLFAVIVLLLLGMFLC